MNNQILPYETIVAGMMVNAFSIDTYTIDNQDLTVMLFPHVPIFDCFEGKHILSAEHTLFHNSGKLYLTMVLFDYDKFRIPNNFTNLLLLNQDSCYTSLSYMHKIEHSYLNTLQGSVLSVIDCIKHLLAQSDFVSAVVRIFRLLVYLQNILEISSGNYKQYKRNLKSLTQFNVKTNFRALDNGTYYIDNIIKPNCKNLLYSITNNNFIHNKMYYPTITFEPEFIVFSPILAFCVYSYKTSDFEKILLNFEKLLLLSAIEELDYVEQKILQMLYAIFKVTYERQKHTGSIHLVQVYTPSMFASFHNELEGEVIDDRRLPLATFQLMPYPYIIQLISLSVDSDKAQILREEFFELLKQVRLNRRVDDMYIQLVAAYYSSFIRLILELNKDGAELPREYNFNFELLIRLLLTVEQLMIDYYGHSYDIDEYFLKVDFYKSEHIQALEKRVTEKHLLCITRTSILVYDDEDEKQTGQEHSIEIIRGLKKLNRMSKLQIAHDTIKARNSITSYLDKLDELQDVIRVNFVDLIPKVFVSNLDDALFNILVQSAVAKIK